jgi:hypothetical protein
LTEFEFPIFLNRFSKKIKKTKSFCWPCTTK